jgi:diguanylate cyclase (GGDEF)-like protein/PAS domain S-box-containing protein
LANDARPPAQPWLGNAEYRQLWEAIPDAVMVVDQDRVIRYANPAVEALVGYSGPELTGQPLSMLLPGDVAARFGAVMAAFLATGQRQLDWRGTRSALRHRAGHVFPVELSFGEVRLGDQRLFATVLRDITERDRADRRQAALQKISEAAHGSADLRTLFPRIHEIIAGLLPAQNFYVALHDAETDVVSFPYFIDAFDPPPDPRPLGAGRGLTDIVLRTGEALLLSPEGLRALVEDHPELSVSGTDGVDWLGIPLKTARGTIGMLTVQSYTGDTRYTEVDMELLQFVSDQVASAVERTRDAEALRLSEGRFHSVFEESPIINCLLSYPDGLFHEMNLAGLKAFGYSRDEVLGRTSTQLDAWVDLAERDRYLELLRARGSVQNFETRMRRRDGQEFTVLYSGSIVSLGGQLYSLNSLQDISERKRAEAALQESEEQFKSSFEHSAIGMALVGLDGRYLRVNSNLCAIFGYDEDQLLARTWRDITHPDDQGLDAGQVRALLDGEGTAFRLEKRYLRRDGSTIHALLAVSLVRDEHGNPRHLIAQVEDISESKRAEQWQRHYSDTLAMIMAEAPTREVLASLARFAEAQSPGMLCSIHMLGPDRRLVHGAAPSLPAWYNAAIDGTPIGPDVGSCGTAAFTGALVVAEDIRHHPAWIEFRDLAAQALLRSCWSHPILSADGQVLGTFAIYRRDVARPDAADLELVRASAGLAAIALERARHHEDQRLARVVFEQSVEGIMVTDAEGRVLVVNPSFEALTGFSAAEVVGQAPAVFDAARHDPQVEAHQREALQATGRWKGEVWGRKKSGEAYPLALSLANVPGPDGAPSHRISILADVSDQKIQAARIEQLAFYDALTGLPNRALFLDRLEQTLAASRRHGGHGAILFLDLDRFKEINDSQGHAVGDMALAEVARRFQTVSRKEETLARLGGDEFVLIAEHADHQAAVRIASRMQRVLAEPLVLMGHSYSVGASIGIAFYPADGQTSEDLIKRTDIAMYRAKASGGGYRLYQAEMGAELEKRLNVAKRLARAMEAGELELYYQPQLDLASRQVIGCEALLRWKDAVLGWVSPGEFIPIAEERGMMGQLGDWVLREACRQVGAWADEGLRLAGRVAINVSAVQLEDPDIVGRLMGIVHAAGLSPEQFELELTESSMMADPERAVEVFELLSAAGFGLSIDDFGTGYSSLSYLKRFAADQIKIDISFVRNMLTDSDDHSIVTTIIAMARSLGLQTTAEGVEEQGQAEALLALGCDFAQGYFFGRPEPAAAFGPRWLSPVDPGTP